MASESNAQVPEENVSFRTRWACHVPEPSMAERTVIETESLSRSLPLPTEPQPSRVYVPTSTNTYRALQLAESEGFDPPRPFYGRPSLSKRVQYQALPTLQKTWCVRPASNRQADGFEPSRYSHSRHSRMVGMERFELSRRSTGS